MKNFLYILFIPIAVGIVIFASCTGDKKIKKDNNYGGTLRINETEFFRTLFPPEAKDVVSSHIVSQVYEGLVKYDAKNLSVLPAIAKKWDIDSSGTIYTFYLNNNVYFHDDRCFKNGKGRLVTANDFKYSFELLCTQSEDNTNFFSIFNKIKGAKKYFDASKDSKPDFDIEGIKVINDTCLQITIEQANPFFINFLANLAAVVLPREGIESYGNKNYIGSGPFMIKELPKTNEPLYLIRNESYYKKDKKERELPYLDFIKISFISSAHKELSLFENDELDIIIGLSGDYISKFLDAHIKEFESDPPEYILYQQELASYESYNLLHSNVNSFFTNNMNYIDLSIVYFQEPIPNSGKKEEGI